MPLDIYKESRRIIGTMGFIHPSIAGSKLFETAQLTKEGTRFLMNTLHRRLGSFDSGSRRNHDSFK